MAILGGQVDEIDLTLEAAFISCHCEICRRGSLMDKLLRLLKDLAEQRFWGSIEIRFEDGKVVHIRKIENIKP